MGKKEEIHKNAVGGRYYYLLFFVFLMLINQFANFANITVIFIVSISLMAILFLNRKVSPDNMGFITIIQMISIVLMIGSYQYFSENYNRLNFFLNFFSGFSCAFSIYGLYFWV